MSSEIEKLKEMSELITKKIENIQTSTYDSSLRSHPSELAEVRKVITLAGKTLGGNKIYYENHIEKVGFSSFKLSDTLDILGSILELIEKRNQRTIRRKKRTASANKKS